MAWIVKDDLDEQITRIRDHWEKVTGKTISKREIIEKLIYENQSARSVVETSGLRMNKKLRKL